jgi:hypothetical protein
MLLILLLKGAFVALATAGLALGLAWCARSEPRPWPVTGALLLGADPDADAEVDLRFRAFLAGVLAVRLVLTLALALPLITAAIAALADVAARALPRAEDDERDDAAVPPATEGPRLTDLLEEARLEVRDATGRVTDPHLQAALEALGEALGEYAVDAPDGGDARARVLGVIALARTCVDAEERRAAELLGVLPDATAEQVAAVRDALVSIYRGPAALPGADPRRAEALDEAVARRARRLAA